MNKYEKNVTSDKVFYLSNGHVLNNLKDLYNEIGQMPEDVFFHHVNAERNDFSSWVRDVMNEKALSAKMAKAGTPVMMKEVLKGLFENEVKAAKATTAKKPVAVKKAAEPKKTVAAAKKTTVKTTASKKAK
ncbi:MAG: hypothetical protein AB9842_06430 [Bacteroidales bacterium]